ncbi:TIGR03013 family XrtA/PEP-CTERM system glycosyltransferase [Ideonella sp. BN130291]|uniref:TIGR03013 family XrtA/PEP-CTERM system glycosyltransferase n=1 Tax=Ideonella sp. BN130291 TaxID=3112940 RepID=UPI002E265BF4|nr:TIGR03013 family XrtA/PEP-CTERM system glycosyltransferase [Ideonella sp. BN130291]
MTDVRVFHHHVSIATLLMLLADALLCFLAVPLLVSNFGSAQGVPWDTHSQNTLVTAGSYAVAMPLLFSVVGIYRRNAVPVSRGAMLTRLLLALLGAAAITTLALHPFGIDTSQLVAEMALLVIGLVVVRVLLVALRHAIGTPRVLIVGTGPDAQRVAQDLGRMGREVVGFYPTGEESFAGHDGKVLSSRLSMEEIVKKRRVREIIVAAREQRGGNVPMEQLLACRSRGVTVLDLAGFYERTHAEVPVDSLKASWLVYGGGFVQGPVRRFVKRVFDIVSSSMLLALASPIMLVAALAIKLESRGPVIYRQERVGLGGRTFMCLKFRSMRSDAEADGVARWAQQNDARITAVGAFIRKCRIDELPQLISVLRGEMSMVGPRPERPSFVELLRKEIPYYDLRHSVKPGLTGWAQIRYKYGSSIDDARRKHQFDLYYVKNNSLFLDLLVLIETVTVVLFGEGAK